jgi:uncharacterized protein YegL
MSVTGTTCLPTYLVLDTSGSMKRHEDLLNETLDRVHDALATSPKVSEFAHMSIISFNDDAYPVLRMTDISQVSALPRLKCSGATNFARAFQLVAAQIEEDVPALRAQGRPVLRPAMFLMTDGVPTDPEEWPRAFVDLTSPDRPRYPHVISFGFGQAGADVLTRVATKGAFQAEDHLNDREALVRILTTLLNSLVTTANQEKLTLPTQVAGFRTLPMEYMD